ncbi:MAG: peptidase P60, partial [Microvirga sp.]
MFVDVMPQSHLILAEARSWIGTPYRHQASLKGIGCDCLGLLRGVWRGVMGREPELP